MSVSGTFLRTSVVGTVLFASLVVIFIAPSFLYGGVDCIAGCVQAQGWPLAFRSVHQSGIADAQLPRGAFDIVPLLADIAIWGGVSLLFIVATRRALLVRFATVGVLIFIAVRMLI